MSTKSKIYLALAGIIGVALVYIATYLGQTADACSSSGEVEAIIGLVLLPIFVVLVFLIPLGKNKSRKILHIFAKSIFIIIFIGYLYVASFNLCS